MNLNALRPLVTAFSFLTRLPLAGRWTAPGAEDAPAAELASSLPWFPVVGAALGALAVGAEQLLYPRFPTGVVAVALIAIAAALSGGLHLDGLADTFDALGGGRGDRARMLEIMRDSRIGAHGATALFLLLAAKLFALVDLLGHGAIWPLFAAPIAARWAVVPLMVFFRYARPDGLGRAFNGQVGHGRAVHVAAATALAAGSLAWLGAPVLLPAAAALATTLALSLALDRRLGGLTGDVYGAAIELAELAFLIAATATDTRWA
jgi:adenosylcobinamide-GDP ribazoletransferase